MNCWWTASVSYSNTENCWVAAIDWTAIHHVSRGNRTGSNGTPSVLPRPRHCTARRNSTRAVLHTSPFNLRFPSLATATFRAISPATYPPLNPASMFTTVTFDAQLSSIPRARPAHRTPRHSQRSSARRSPGRERARPPRSAAALPCRPRRQSRRHRPASGGWRPADAGPPRRHLARSVTSAPVQRAVSRASSATGKSLVPAVTIVTRPATFSVPCGSRCETCGRSGCRPPQ